MLLQSWKAMAMRTVSSTHGDTFKSVSNREINKTSEGWKTTSYDIKTMGAIDSRVTEDNILGSKQMIAIRDAGGNIIDYKFAIEHDEKQDLLGLNLSATSTLGSMYANLLDLHFAKDINERIYNSVIADSVENIQKKNIDRTGTLGTYGDETKNMEEYVIISPNSKDSVGREIWEAMPRDMKSKIAEGNSKSELFVRRSVAAYLFGYRDPSINDADIMKYLPHMVRTFLQMSEMLWKEIVAQGKIGVVIKMPIVPIMNILSNFLYSTMMGDMPWKVASRQFKATKATIEFLKVKDKIVVLENKINSKTITKKELNDLSSLRSQQNSNYVKKYFDAGLYTSLSEDLTMDENKNDGTIARTIESGLDKMPKIVKDGLKLAFMSQDTKMFKFMQTATSMSDFVARISRDEYLESKGMKKDERFRRIRDDFINYELSDSRFITYLDKMGLLMFTKFAFGILKPLKKGLLENPANLILAGAMQELTGDADDVLDKLPFGGKFGGTTYWPDETIVNSILPRGALLAGDVMGI